MNASFAHAKKAGKQAPIETISAQQLPPEACRTLTLIYQNGPFPNRRDGVVFGNREKQLPIKPRGYYHEYTVPTPGARDRGARRIVCGGKKSAPDLCYYTADHYQSFRRINHISNETAQP
ncbi:MAG: ribonuclease [Burkholderiales bacterium]|nr:ribonuclease [Burkholderiales bacterium]